MSEANNEPFDQNGRLLDRLIELAIKDGLPVESAEAGREMHKLVDFYEPPVGYIGRLRTIKEMSNLAMGEAKLANQCPQLARWRPYVDAVLAKPIRFAKDLKLDADSQALFLAETGSDPLRSRALVRHALEGLLWPAIAANDEGKHRKYLLLQGQMTIAQIAILTAEFDSARQSKRKEPDESVYEYLYGPCLFARRFTRRGWADALSSLPDAIDPKDYQEHLERLLEESRSASADTFHEVTRKGFQEAVGSISAVIKRGLRGEKYQKREYANGQPKTAAAIEVSALSLDAHGFADAETVVAELVTRTHGTPEERDALDRAGEAPEDHLRRRHIILTAGGPSVAEHVRARMTGPISSFRIGIPNRVRENSQN